MFNRIKAKLYESLHKQPYGTEDVISIHDIIIPKSFKKKSSKPKEFKLDKARSFYLDNGYVDKPIEVKKINMSGKTKYLLRDGYTRFIALRNYNVEKAPIKYIVT